MRLTPFIALCLIATVACTASESVISDGGGSGAGGADVEDPGGGDVGVVPGRVECTDLPAAPLDCSPFWGCFGATPRECVAVQCPRTPSAVSTSEAFSTCVGDACAGQDPDDQQACAEEMCRIELVECIADGDDDTCWSYEACIQRECLPLQAEDADPPASDEEIGACLDRCLDDVATDRCRQCRGAVYSGFMEANCASDLLAWRNCGEANECTDSECVTDRCPHVTATLETCLDDQVAANPDDLQGRLADCYEPEGSR